MGNVNMEASQINYRGGATKMSVEEALKNTSGEAAAIAQLQTDVFNLNSNKANQITIAPFFSAETYYDPGDLVYYNGLSYRCVNAHEGEWDADDFAATTISNELDSLKSGLIDKVKRFSVGNIPAQTMRDFVLGVINAIANDIEVDEIAEVFAVYPDVNYFMFTILNFEGPNYMFRANNTAAMYYGTVNISTNAVSLYLITATSQ